MGTEDSLPYAFVSYCHRDAQYAQRLANAFAEHGIEIWIDKRVTLGERWPHIIQRKLDASCVVVLIMTSRAFASEWVTAELNRAQRLKKRIVPLLLEGEPWLQVEALQYLDVRDQALPQLGFFQTLRATLDVAASAETPSGGRTELPDAQAQSRTFRRRPWVWVSFVLLGLFALGYFVLPMGRSRVNPDLVNSQLPATTQATISNVEEKSVGPKDAGQRHTSPVLVKKLETRLKPSDFEEASKHDDTPIH